MTSDDTSECSRVQSVLECQAKKSELNQEQLEVSQRFSSREVKYFQFSFKKAILMAEQTGL